MTCGEPGLWLLVLIITRDADNPRPSMLILGWYNTHTHMNACTQAHTHTIDHPGVASFIELSSHFDQ